MELVTDRIKVNSVCPGNFFDGPLWSNPERGLFVQYLNSGKVPGARTIEDVKRFYGSVTETTSTSLFSCFSICSSTSSSPLVTIVMRERFADVGL